MSTWSVEVRIPVSVWMEVEADTEEEAEELALADVDFTQGEADGVPQIVSVEKEAAL